MSLTSSFVTHTTKELFQLKLIGLVCVFVYGFYRFTWALLQYNYFLALIGVGAAQGSPDAGRRPTALGNQMSVVLNSAVTSFHSGFRTLLLRARLGRLVLPSGWCSSPRPRS